MNYVLDHLWAVIDTDIANARIDTANARIAELERALLKCKSIIVEKLELVEELEGHILQLAEGTDPCSPL
jgi:hypothetical protein